MHQVQFGEVIGDPALEKFNDVGDTGLLDGVALDSERGSLALIGETFNDLRQSAIIQAAIIEVDLRDQIMIIEHTLVEPICITRV